MCVTEAPHVKQESDRIEKLKQKLKESNEKAEKLEIQNEDMMEQIDRLEYTMDKQDSDFKQQLGSWYKELEKYKEEITQSTLLTEEKQRKADSDISEIKRIRESQEKQLEMIRMKTMSGFTSVEVPPGVPVT